MRVRIGDYLRDIRIANNQTLKQMADELGVTSAFLSAIENGKKNMPEKWYSILASRYRLNNSQIDDLKSAAEESSTSVKMNLANTDGASRRLAVTFARSFQDLSDEDSAKILKILKKKE